MVDEHGFGDTPKSIHTFDHGVFELIALGNDLYHIQIALAAAASRDFFHWMIAATGLNLRRLPRLQIRYRDYRLDLAPSASLAYRLIEEQMFNDFIMGNPVVLGAFAALAKEQRFPRAP